LEPSAAKLSLHIDKRAGDLAARLTSDNAYDLFDTKTVAAFLGVSTQWLEIGRHKKYGPPFVRLAKSRIRYRRDALVKWLLEREFVWTKQYTGEAA
jgi:hypothetical protein